MEISQTSGALSGGEPERGLPGAGEKGADWHVGVL